ncbi:hypothetical protein [Pantoea sp. KPR_PJ]|uniref:hypothetical protein n=1 Tax=Pantoea sp. KPR_PJ TaxID=2738375 RepID=UPI0035280153
MASHIVDFPFTYSSFAIPEMRGVWSEQNRLNQQAQVEVARAQAEGEPGVSPDDAAQAMVACAPPQTDNRISDDKRNHWRKPVNSSGPASRKVDDVIAAAYASGQRETPP